MSSRYGEPRRRAQLELRAAAAQFVDAKLMVRWLDQLGGAPAAAQVLEERQAQVLRCARSFEAALNHVVNLELLAAERPPEALAADRPPGPEGSEVSGAEPEPKRRRTIPIVGDPDKPKRDQPRQRASLPHRSRQRRNRGHRPPHRRVRVLRVCVTLGLRTLLPRFSTPVMKRAGRAELACPSQAS